VWGAVQFKADLSQVAGPVGIVGLVGEASSFGITALLLFTAFISLNLAIINLLPFPALDGGRLLFVIIEAVKGSPINPRYVQTLNTVGFALLILLMVAVTYNDIARIL
jgi:regulator of sigma E protease